MYTGYVKLADYTQSELENYVRSNTRQTVHEAVKRLLVGSELHTRLTTAKATVKLERRLTRPTFAKSTRIAADKREVEAEAVLIKESALFKSCTPIPGRAGYSITPTGVVWSEKSLKWLKQSTGKSGQGYKYVHFTDRTEYIHRLVAITYIPNPENKRTVNHIDGNAKNNNVANLEWATHAENTHHAIDTGLFLPGGENGLTATEVDKIRERLHAGDMHTHIAADIGVTATTVGNIARGKSHAREGTPTFIRRTPRSITAKVREFPVEVSTSEIAKMLGIKYSVAYDARRRLK